MFVELFWDVCGGATESLDGNFGTAAGIELSITFDAFPSTAFIASGFAAVGGDTAVPSTEPTLTGAGLAAADPDEIVIEARQ